ncbi:AraC family transcriptional regulator [Methylobacterium oryzihabitans]|uniref:AraC family transcriptional regulator n=1 Tax=Methylobacterium oryzihabitans TaxID=2499852 RepID=A0A3S2YTL0_9HYPH|nr:AraC family transcriptional regulator [Methylobacterium oryzihabitans]RVU19151.1 AraC family transcriptional regulator [Methylobacterium oryzihabitans]
MGSETEGAPGAPGPVRVRVDRDSHPDPVARAQAWREATSVSMDTAVEPGDLAAFAGSVGVHPVGPFLVTDLCLGPATLLRSQSVRAEWEHDHVIADCVVSGRLHGQIGGRAVDAGPGDCLMVDLKGGMHARVVDGTRILGLIMPRVVFEAATGEPGAVDGVVFAAASPAGAVLGGLLTSLAAQVDRLPDRAALALARAVVAVSAAFVVPRSAAPAGGDPDRPPVALPTLAQLRRFIDREAARPELGIESLCAQFGLSRTMLYRVFAPAGGVAAVIRQRRAALAVDLLTRLDASGLTVVEVARASGFGTERSLRNALRELYGATPRTIMRDGLVAERRNEVSAAEIGRLFDDL